MKTIRKENKLVVVHIISQDGGGIASFIKNLIETTSGNITHHVFSFTEPGEEFVALLLKHGGSYKLMPRPKKEGYRTFFQYIYNELNSINDVDLIHCHIPGVKALPFYIISKSLRAIPFAIHGHQTQKYYGAKNRFIEQMAANFDMLCNICFARHKFACGLDAAKYTFGRRRAKSIHILHNGIDIEKYTKFYALLHEKTRTTSLITIGHIGRHTRQKNFGFIIKLLVYLKKNNVNFKFESVGKGEDTTKIVEMLQKNKLQKDAELLGFRDNISELLNSFDVFILPSYSEGLPTVAIEAQAVGIPCILSDRITREVDLGLGLTTFLSIDPTVATLEEWRRQILTTKTRINIPTKKERRTALIANMYSNESVANDYIAYLRKSIMHEE